MSLGSCLRRLFSRKPSPKTPRDVEYLTLLAQRRDVQRAIMRKGGVGIEEEMDQLRALETKLGWYPRPIQKCRPSRGE